VREFIVSNDLASTDTFMDSLRKFGRPNAHMVPRQISGPTGHGTKMATIAAGKLNGIAPNADLYLMKIKGQWNSGRIPHEPDKSVKIHAAALVEAFDETKRDVQARLALNKNAKSVINMSWGKLAEQITTVFKSTNFPTGVEADIGEGPNVESKFPDFLDWCTSLEIPIVVAAGNSPNKWLHQQVSHKFGKPDNLIVTVGGVEPDGMLYLDTTPAQPGNKDSLSGSMSRGSDSIGSEIFVPGTSIFNHFSTIVAIVNSFAITSFVVSIGYVSPASIFHNEISSFSDARAKYTSLAHRTKHK
jgi:hypothetical protein